MQFAVAISDTEMHLTLSFPFVAAWWMKAASNTNQPHQARASVAGPEVLNPLELPSLLPSVLQA